jgi:hypothetical protein
MSKTKTSNAAPSFTGRKLAIGVLAAIGLAVGGVVYSLQSSAAPPNIVVYKSPTCGCCEAWVDHLKANGFNVTVHNQFNMDPIKREKGVPTQLQSCHTAQIGDYVIEGHVPAANIVRLLQEKPPVKGLTAPGMPQGSPGMKGPVSEPYEVLAFQSDGRTAVYARHNQ